MLVEPFPAARAGIWLCWGERGALISALHGQDAAPREGGKAALSRTGQSLQHSPVQVGSQRWEPHLSLFRCPGEGMVPTPCTCLFALPNLQHDFCHVLYITTCCYLSGDQY